MRPARPLTCSRHPAPRPSSRQPAGWKGRGNGILARSLERRRKQQTRDAPKRPPASPSPFSETRPPHPSPTPEPREWTVWVPEFPGIQPSVPGRREPAESVLGGEGRGAVKMGGGPQIIFLQRGGRRGGEGRGGAGWGREEVTWGARRALRRIRRPTSAPPGGAGGPGGGASRWRRGARQSRTPLLPPPPPPPLPLRSPAVLQALAAREELRRRRVPRGK